MAQISLIRPELMDSLAAKIELRDLFIEHRRVTLGFSMRSSETSSLPLWRKDALVNHTVIDSRYLLRTICSGECSGECSDLLAFRAALATC